MPKISGFEMLELLEEPPVIIFTTAFDHYAIKAFEVNAADYKKLLNVSTFLKGEEFYHLVADFPKKNKFVQWVA
jgi:DNA-binding LytR/AlgR family response regulator